MCAVDISFFLKRKNKLDNRKVAIYGVRFLLHIQFLLLSLSFFFFLQKKMSSVVTGVGISSVIEDAITSGNIVSALCNIDVQHVAKTVNFCADAVTSSPQYRYTIHVSGKFPASGDTKDQIVCFFPTHHEEKMQILRCNAEYQSRWRSVPLVAMNIEINERLRAVSQNGYFSTVAANVRFLIGYGEHIYNCANLDGTIYVLWATITRHHLSKRGKGVTYQRPILVNMDGYARVKGIFILTPLVKHEDDVRCIPLQRRNLSFIIDSVDIFVCEKANPNDTEEERKKKHRHRHMRYISRRKLKELLQSPTTDALTWVPLQQNAFDGSGGDDVMIDSDSSSLMMMVTSQSESDVESVMDHHLGDWNKSPRHVNDDRDDSYNGDLFLNDGATPRTIDSSMSLSFHTLKYGTSSPSSLNDSATSKLYEERDPFEEYEMDLTTRDEEDEERVLDQVMGSELTRRTVL